MTDTTDRVQVMAAALVENGYGTPKAGKDAATVLASFDRLTGESVGSERQRLLLHADYLDRQGRRTLAADLRGVLGGDRG